ncbi:hypothetical protein BDC45DRAFT_416805, partial [Circinella umbellata]
GEMTSKAATNSYKLYKDKAKSVLASKVHLNHICLLMPIIPPKNILLVRLPIIQIRGLTCYIYCLTFVYEGTYYVQEI